MVEPVNDPHIGFYGVPHVFLPAFARPPKSITDPSTSPRMSDNDHSNVFGFLTARTPDGGMR
jgi:hypothetical protein